MPTTKDRTPAAWRSQVPTDVRSLARGAADLKGDRNQSGPRAKPADRTGKGPIYRLRGLTDAAVPETINRSQSVPILVEQTSRTHAELAVARNQPASKQGHEEWMPLSHPRY